MSLVKVAVLMGSDSDLGIMRGTAQTLEEFGIAYELRVLSAHRTPEDVQKFIKKSQTRGFKVLIAGAGGAAHLAGVLAAHSTLPVIGVPIDSSPLKGWDALLATVQMPSGVPVATVAVGKAGAKNAAILAAQILALSDSGLKQKLIRYKKTLAAKVREQDRKLQSGGYPPSQPTPAHGQK